MSDLRHTSYQPRPRRRAVTVTTTFATAAPTSVKYYFERINEIIENVDKHIQQRLSCHQNQVFAVVRGEIEAMKEETQLHIRRLNEEISLKNQSDQIWKLNNQLDYFKSQVFVLFQKVKQYETQNAFLRTQNQTIKSDYHNLNLILQKSMYKNIKHKQQISCQKFQQQKIIYEQKIKHHNVTQKKKLKTQSNSIYQSNKQIKQINQNTKNINRMRQNVISQNSLTQFDTFYQLSPSKKINDEQKMLTIIKNKFVDLEQSPSGQSKIMMSYSSDSHIVKSIPLHSRKKLAQTPTKKQYQNQNNIVSKHYLQRINKYVQTEEEKGNRKWIEEKMKTQMNEKHTHRMLLTLKKNKQRLYPVKTSMNMTRV